MGSIENGHNDNPAVVCVFCGTSPGNAPSHISAAKSLAQVFAQNNIKLIFGGGTSGLMGEVASTLVSLSGPDSAHGVIPKALIDFERKDTKDEEEKYRITFGKTTVVQDMHTRKQTMVDEVLKGGPGSGFVALSGGYGTLEELMEIVTWNQLGIHDKPVVLYNVEGYYDGLLEWVKKAVSTGFVAKGNSHIMSQAHSAEEVVKRLRDYESAEGRLELQWEEGEEKK